MQQALGPDAPQMLYYKDLPAEIRGELWRRFSEALEPLRQPGKLGAVHFQFAPWLLRNREGMAHVEECVERMEGHLVAVEFRNKSWFDGDNAAQDPRLRARAGRGAHHRRWTAGLCQQRAVRLGGDESANWPCCACMAATTRRGTRRAPLPPAASTTGTSRTNWRRWCRRSSTSARWPATYTCFSTRTTKTRARLAPACCATFSR